MGVWLDHYLTSPNGYVWILDSKCYHLSKRGRLVDKENSDVLAALRARAPNPGAKARDKWNVKIAWVLVIGRHFQSARWMEQQRKGKIVTCHAWFIFHFINSFSIPGKAEQQREGWQASRLYQKAEGCWARKFREQQSCDSKVKKITSSMCFKSNWESV